MGSGASGSNPGLYLFWGDQSLGSFPVPVAAQCVETNQRSNSPPAWGVPMVLLAAEGGVIPMRDQGAVSATTALDADSFLVACPIVLKGSPALYIGVFNTQDQKPNGAGLTWVGILGSWKARSDVVITNAMLATFNCVGNNGAPTFYDVGGNISITTFPAGLPAGSIPSPNAAPGMYAMVAMVPTFSTPDSNNNKFSWPVQLMLPLGKNGVPLTNDTPKPTLFFNQMLPKSATTVTTDAAGRAVVWMLAQNNLYSATYATFTVPVTASSFELVAPGSSSNEPISVLFYLDGGAAYPGTTPDGLATHNYPVYLMAFYGDSANLQVRFYGTVVITPDYATAIPTYVKTIRELTRMRRLASLTVPIPNENVAGWQFEAGENDLATISYGRTQTSGSGASATWSWNVGLEVDTQFMFSVDFATSFGFTLGLDYQYVGALGNSSTSTSTVTTTYGLKADVNMNSVDTPDGPVTTQIGVNMIKPGHGIWDDRGGLLYQLPVSWQKRRHSYRRIDEDRPVPTSGRVRE